MQKLSIGVQAFEVMRTQGFIYKSTILTWQSDRFCARL